MTMEGGGIVPETHGGASFMRQCSSETENPIHIHHITVMRILNTMTGGDSNLGWYPVDTDIMFYQQSPLRFGFVSLLSRCLRGRFLSHLAKRVLLWHLSDKVLDQQEC